MNKLSLYGVLIDKVKDTATAYEEGLVNPTFEEWESLACNADEHRHSVYPTGCTRADAFWRTMIRDTIRDYQAGEKIRRANAVDEVSYTRFRAWITEQSDKNNTDEMANLEFANFRKSFFIATQYQRFFTTYKGYMGLGDVPQANDEIWILFGGNVPFILRRYPDRSGHADSYSLVGDCYVHGIMDGEAMEALGEKESREVCLV